MHSSNNVCQGKNCVQGLAVGVAREQAASLFPALSTNGAHARTRQRSTGPIQAACSAATATPVSKEGSQVYSPHMSTTEGQYAEVELGMTVHAMGRITGWIYLAYWRDLLLRYDCDCSQMSIVVSY